MNTNHIIASLLMLTAALGLHAGDNISSLGEKGRFVINGNVDPSFGNLFEMAVTGYLDNYSKEIAIDNDGNFQSTIDIEGPLQEAYLYINNDAVSIPLMPDKTVTVNCNNGKLTLSSNDKDFDRDLEFALLCHKNMRKRFLDINVASYYALTDSAKSALIDSINDYINDYNKLIDDFEASSGTLANHNYFVHDAYFGVVGFIAGRPDLLPRITAGQAALKSSEPYKCITGDDMKYPNTRSFASRHITFNATLNVYNDSLLSNDDYYNIIRASRGISPDSLTADVVNAYQLCNSMVFDPYEKIRPFADKTIEGITTPWLRSLLSKAVENYKLTSTGSDLPPMKLIDADGRELSLDSFKGKPVLLDFWSTGCGPCLEEFRQMDEFKKALGDKADNLQIVTVCCGNPDNRLWKNMIKRHNLNDINTVIMHNESAPIYSTIGYPTYILVGPDGKIVEWNTDRPSTVLFKKQNNIPTTLDTIL